MAKAKKSFVCQNCGNHSSSWMGRCNACGEWNTFIEEVTSLGEEKPKHAKLFNSGSTQKASKPLALHEITAQQITRHTLKDQELNRVLGGGLVPGSITLIGGEPGIGKSTLLLQLALQFTEQKVLYVSGEESEQQIRMRADRLGIQNNNCYILSETSLVNLFDQIELLQPQILVVDSIQTMYTSVLDAAPGSVSQIRECTGQLLRYAKESGVPVFLIGHITKDGNLAGPKVLEHMVDTVLQFEGDRNHIYRLLRTIKNRFGSTNELGIYEMQGEGLREVSNPSEILIANQNKSLSGVAIAATLEGARPLLIEVQALVSSAAYGTPQRSSTGYDLRRLNMLLAVLEKRCGFRLGVKDVFLNIAGGIKVDDPSIDLAVVAAILSSNEDIAIHPEFCFAAEVGLSGEIRPVTRIDQRISEAEKLGFTNLFVSAYNFKKATPKTAIQLHQVTKIEEVFQHLFG